MQNVGAAWMMATLAPSALLVALVQTATNLPVFLLGIPAGAVADIVDRRKLLVITQGWMLAAALALGILTLSGATGPWTLLALTFALGLGATMNGPAWQAIMPELVPKTELPARSRSTPWASTWRVPLVPRWAGWLSPRLALAPHSS